MSDNIISIRNLTKSFDSDEVLRGINLEIPRGKHISIIGRSGCGKTTFLRCIAGLEIISSGYLRIEDSELDIKADSGLDKLRTQDLKKEIRSSINSIRMNVGFLFQQLHLFPNKSVLENVTLAPVIVNKSSKDEAHFLALKYLDKVGMKKQVNKMPHELSGGQAQRVAIARALAMSPKVMLYDEPTSALDPELVGEILQVMKSLKEEGMTQIVVTHLLRFAKSISDDIIYMEDGKIEEMNTPEVIFDKPNSPKTSKYISSLLQ